MNHPDTIGRRGANCALLCAVAFAGTYASPARAANDHCVGATQAASLYDYGWQAYERQDWIAAFGWLEFYYLLTANSGQLQQDQPFMAELIAAKNHAVSQLIAMRDENQRLRAQIAEQAKSSTGIGTKYSGIHQPPPALRRTLPPALQ